MSACDPANATQRRVQVESLPAGNGECTPVNGNISQCGPGGRVYTFTAPEEGQYVQTAGLQRRLGTKCALY